MTRTTRRSADEAWRHPADVVSCWDGAGGLDPALLRYRATGSWWDCLESAGLTLLVTREYEHLVVALSVARGKPLVSYMSLPHPSGLAVDRNENVVHIASTRNPNQIYDLAAVRELMRRPDVKRKDLARVTLVPTRARMFPGSLYTHDLAFVGKQLYANAVGFNAVARIGERGFDLAWWPRCVEARNGGPIQRNHLQLNSIAAGASLRSSFFTASSDTVSRHRPGHVNFPVDGRGVVFSGATREPVAFGLTRPHSARLRNGRVWVLNSGYGQYGFVDGRSFRSVAALPGWTRGLCFHERTAFVATSRVLPRFRHYAPGVDVSRAVCGVHAIDVESGRIIGSLTWPAGDQIFAVDWLPRGVAEALPFVMGEPEPPRSLFYAYHVP